MNGVVYMNTGTKCITRLIVSLSSLREHWAGAVAIYNEGSVHPALESACKKYAALIVPFNGGPLNTYSKKVKVVEQQGFDNMMFIDADTLICAPLEPFFDLIAKHRLVFVNFSNWSTTGGIVGGRIRRYQSLYPDLVGIAMAYGTAINTGTFGISKGHEMIPQWLEVAEAGGKAGVPLTDEIAAQLIAPLYPHYLAPPEWGYSVRYGAGACGGINNAKVIHYHGRKHTGASPECTLWTDRFWAIKDEFGLSDWGDTNLKRYVRKNRKRPPTQKTVMSLVRAIEDVTMESSEPDQPPLEDEAEVPTPPTASVSSLTYVTAVDSNYVAKLQKHYPKWRKYLGIDKVPVVVLHDSTMSSDELNWLSDYPNIRLVPWNMPNAANQREKMLSAFILGIPENVHTPHWVKLDADCHIERNTESPIEWPKDWFETAFTGHRWGYTKCKGDPQFMLDQKHWLNRLDAWWTSLGMPLKNEDLFPIITGARYSHPRINSYVCVHDTEFSNYVAALCGDRLPVPSHDTVLWYVAHRLGMRWGRVNMSHLGFHQ